MKRYLTSWFSDSSSWNLKQKLIYTIFVLLVYRVGVSIAVPFVDSSVFKQMMDSSEAGSLVMTAMTMTGASLFQLGVFSLGVMPFITASIVFQVFKVIIPRLKEMYENPIDLKRVTQWTRYASVIFSGTTSIGILYGADKIFGIQVLTSKSPIAFIVAWFSLVVGALLVMRMGESITNKGVSNGTSLLIFTSILANMPNLVGQAWMHGRVWSTIGFFLMVLAVLALVVYVEKSEYRVRVIYPKAAERQRVTSNFIPVKVAIAGVLPVIFVSSILSLPMLLDSVFKWGWAEWLNNHFAFDSPLYLITYVVLVFLFTFFAIEMVFSIDQITKQVRMQGGIMPDKPKDKTVYQYLEYITESMGWLDAVYLSVISLVTLTLFPLVGLGSGAFGATSIIILSTVVVTLLAAIDADKASSLEGVRLLRR